MTQSHHLHNICLTALCDPNVPNVPVLAVLSCVVSYIVYDKIAEFYNETCSFGNKFCVNFHFVQFFFQRSKNSTV